MRQGCSVQVGIIRQVEVELDNTLRDLRDSHKEEAAKLKKWRALDKDVQAKLAEFPIQGESCLWQTSLQLLCLESHEHSIVGAHQPTSCFCVSASNINNVLSDIVLTSGT